jgi:taspase (threonine aspartase 1)
MISIHCGAGWHSSHKEKEYKRLMKRVLEPCRKMLLEGKTATELVEIAVKLLEQEPLTNAGLIGSNLALNGSVECDACILDQEGFYGAVAAVPMTKSLNAPLDIHILCSPIEVANSIRKDHRNGPSLAGRQPPLMLSGVQAHSYAKLAGAQLMDRTLAIESLTQSQIQRYHNHMAILDSCKDEQHKNLSDILQDTVGAVAVDIDGKMACAVSSGGISLKHPGRIGEAAIVDAGVSIALAKDRVIGCSLSGTGEQIMKTRLGSKITNTLVHSSEMVPDLGKLVHDQFLTTPLISLDKEKNMGAIIICNDGGFLEMLWVHTTPSFCIGMCSARSEKYQIQITRRTTDTSICIGSQSI